MHLYRSIQLGILLTMFTTAGTAFAQDRFSFSTGYGYYETINAGVNWHWSEKSSMGIYAGTNFGLNDRRIRSIGVDYSRIYPNELFWKLRPGFSLQGQYWSQDDENYWFGNVALLMHGVLQYPISQTLQVNLEGGGVLNYATDTDRKQNTTAGFPKRWNGNVAIGIIYQLNRKS